MLGNIEHLNKVTGEKVTVIEDLKRKNEELCRNHDKSEKEVKLDVKNRLNRCRQEYEKGRNRLRAPSRATKGPGRDRSD